MRRNKTIFFNDNTADYDEEVKSINKFQVQGEIIKRLNTIKLTQKQEKLMRIIEINQIVSVTGPAGTSKTFMAIYAALKFLIQNDKDAHIFLTKPIVEAGEKLGHLPGEISDKIDPYLKSYIDLFNEILKTTLTNKLFDDNKAEFEPVAYMRGRNLENSFIIIDEAQNYTMSQLMTLVTRKHKSSKIILIGDYLQDDRFNNKNNPFKTFNTEILSNIQGTAQFTFAVKDIMRDPIIIELIENYTKFLNKNN